MLDEIVHAAVELVISNNKRIVAENRNEVRRCSAFVSVVPRSALTLVPGVENENWVFTVSSDFVDQSCSSRGAAVAWTFWFTGISAENLMLILVSNRRAMISSRISKEGCFRR